MGKEEKTHDVPLDAVSSALRWSKVSKKTKKTYSHFYWLIGGAIAVILVLAISSRHSKNSQYNNTAAKSNTSYSASLNANLARLRALANQGVKFIVASNTGQTSLISPQVSKAYLARQNAPTSMYLAPSATPFQRCLSAKREPSTLSGIGSNTQFANINTSTTIEAKTIAHPDFTIVSGEFLHAVLETAINSDLPGIVRAVVSQPAYSYTGEHAVIPAGSRLIGQYLSGIVQGQNRVMIIWNRVVLPGGVVVQLNSPGIDHLGRVGQGADSVNTHFFARFGESALLSLIGAGAATTGVNTADQYNSASSYRMVIAQSFQQSARQSLQGTLPMKPTIHVYQGANINVFVAHDLSFYRAFKGLADLPRPMLALVK